MRTAIVSGLVIAAALSAAAFSARAGESFNPCPNTNLLTEAVVMRGENGWVRSVGGDFNGDGKTDMCWTHKETGDEACWLMCGLVPIQQVPVVEARIQSGNYSE